MALFDCPITLAERDAERLDLGPRAARAHVRSDWTRSPTITTGLPRPYAKPRSRLMATKKKQWPEDFTAEEVSAVISCLANHYPLCCEENFWRIRLVTDDDAKRDALADFAHENWGCDGNGLFPSGKPTHAERYFTRALETVVELWRP